MLKKKLEEARKNLAEIKAAVENGEKSAEDLQKAIDAVNEAKSNLEAAKKAEELMGSFGTNDVDDEQHEEAQAKAKSLGDAFVEVAKKANLSDKTFRVVMPAAKANTDTQVSPSGAIDFASTFDTNVVEAARIPLVVRDLFGAEQISGSALVYLVEGAIEGAAAETAEGVAKPQVHFADPTPKTVSLDKIACFIKESDEYISDYPFLASAINGRLLYQLGLAIQNKLVADLIATSGIQTDSTTWTAASTETDIADLILKSAMDVQNASGFAADGIIMNPATWYALRVAKASGTGEYFGGGFFGAQNVPNLWGIPVCVTTAVTASQIIVGAFKTCGSVVSKGGVGVDATNTDADDFTKNLMTIRAEERLALAVRRPSGFMLLTK